MLSQPISGSGSRGESSRAQSTPVAGGGRSDLRPGEEKRAAAQARTGHACDAPGDTGRSHGHLAGDGLLRTAQHRFHRAGESERPTWRGGSGASHVGHREARPSTPGSPRVVASLLSCCAPPCSTADSARAAARTRRKVGGATRAASHGSSGSGEKQPTVVNAGSPVLSLAAGAMLHNVSMNEARRILAKWKWAVR
jgi:hypothetical protein